MSLLLAIVLIILMVIVGFIKYARWNYGTLEQLGIPVLQPHFILGSLPDLHTKVQQLEDIERFKKFGPVFGLYEGRYPQIHVCDPELIRQIFVKDHDYFLDREHLDLGHAVTKEILDLQSYDKWKLLRSLWTPTVSVSRIKYMSNQMGELVYEFVQDLIEETHGLPLKVDIRSRFVVILTDILTTCLHGFQMKDRKDSNNQLIQLMRIILRENVQYDWSYNLSLVFPFLKSLYSPFRTHGLDSFHSLIKQILKSRLLENRTNNNDRGRKDYSDMLLELESKISSPEYSSINLNEYTITAQALELFFAIYDSTGTVMTMLIYYLTQHSEIQDKLIEEIDTAIESHEGVVDYDTIGELPYLTACLNESMRLTPPFLRPERICTKDWEFNGLKIPKGMPVLIPLFALHRHPEYFSNPNEFEPERFMPENKSKLHPYAFSTFGHGPKNCVGMKLAYETMRMILCRFFKDFRVKMVEGETKIDFKPGTLFAAQYKPIVVEIIPRKLFY